MDRRQALKALAIAAASPLAAQTPPKPAPDPNAGRRAPMVILYSQTLIDIEYPELGDIVKQMGFDGVDLSIMPGGHVEPRLANVDLVRAFEVMEGNTLAVPVITTALTTPMDRTAVPVIALAGMSGAKIFRPGYWQNNGNPNPAMRLGEVQRDFFGLVNIARQYTMAGAIHNSAGDNVGASISDIQRIVEPIDGNSAGYYFDVCNAAANGGAGGWEAAMRMAMPRIKAVIIQDFTWEKQNGRSQITKCPLGQGVVDWPKFFQMLAQANFTGPITLQVDYKTKAMPSAIVSDLQFTRKQVQTAWGPGPKT
jgi:L-ribulose-5-phosphate 3-epimerase